jgi:putative ABC transport system permease protein
MRLLRLAPWRRGPALLLRRPGVAVALLAAALVAALPAAAAPMFLSSAQHATLHRQIDRTCPAQVGPYLTGPVAPAVQRTFGPDAVVGGERFRQREQAVAAAAAQVPGLAVPVSTGHGQVNAELVDRPLLAPDLAGLTLLGRDGFEDQVVVVAGPAGEGLWLPHEYARRQGVEVGDELRLTARGRPLGAWAPPGSGTPGQPTATTLPVAAIYRDLRAAPDTPYWCGVADVYRGSEDPNLDPPPPAALVDTATFLAVGGAAQMLAGQVIEVPVADPTLTTPQAARLAPDIERLRTDLFTGHPELFSTGRFDRTIFQSHLGRFEQRAELVRTGLLPPVVPITAAGTLVGLAVAAAAGVFWVQRRRPELAVLAAHGVGTGALGVKAAAEALPAVVVGTAAGWAAAWALVAGVGPSPVLAPGVPAWAGAAAAGAGLVGLGLIGRLAAGGARGLADARPVTARGHWWGRVPWELGLLAAAPAAWWLLAADQTNDPTAGGVGTVVHVPARLLVVPILIIAGLALLAARVAAAGLRARRRGSRETAGSSRETAGSSRETAGAGRWLAGRRLVRAAGTTAILAAATAVPVAMAGYGAAATGSIRTTADAQLRFSLGSDTVISYRSQLHRELDRLPPPPPAPESMAGRATQVLRLNQQRLAGLSVDLLAVDPETFTDGAYWDARIGGASLADAVGRLTTGDPPTVVASRRLPPGPAILQVGGEQLRVEVAATRPLPGAQSAYPMVIIHRDALAAGVSQPVLDFFRPQIWVAGDPARTQAEIQDAGLAPDFVVTIEQQRAGALYEPVAYTFQYLIALSIFTGLIGAVGLLLYLESRTAAHRRAYAMLRRLGLSAGMHRRALLLEVGAPVAVGLAGGICLAVVLAYWLGAGFDLDPGRFPDTLLVLPVSMAGVVTAAALTLAITAGLLSHARIARAHPGEVLRDTG